MTNRVRFLVVELDAEYRVDDAESGVITALKLIKGVKRVTPQPEHGNLERLRATSDVADRLRDLAYRFEREDWE